MQEELRRIAASVEELRGWDFSPARTARDPTPWGYADVVRRYLQPSSHVLDIGTGGGERLLSLAPHFASGVGIDCDPAMIRVARENCPPSLATKVDFEIMDAESLDFPDASFDVVLNRHCTVFVEPIVRVLRPGGLFITQQVGRRNTGNLLGAFGWTADSFGPDWGQELADLAESFRARGCTLVAQGEYNVPQWFCDVESLIFWLKSAPLPEDFDIKKHGQGVQTILDQYATPQGIKTNEHRELLIVQKQGSYRAGGNAARNPTSRAHRKGE